jgi:putative PIN family toxin of toxin-antitoxin system
VRVFLDTNVLASAFGTRGLCSDVLRLILAEHELLTGEIVIDELRAVLSRKFGVPTKTVDDIESFLRGYHVEPRPRELPNLKLADRSDVVVVSSAIKAEAEILVTGDQEILELREKLKGVRICSPRDFWEFLSKERQRRVR